ncbi:MAG: response regulator transcription factor [Limisphaerales bacterium]
MNGSKPTQKCLNLSLRQEQVLELLSQGKTIQETSHHLGLSFNTVHTHIKRLYKKLGVENRTRAAIAFKNSKYLESNLTPEKPPEWAQTSLSQAQQPVFDAKETSYLCPACGFKHANRNQTVLLK